MYVCVYMQLFVDEECMLHVRRNLFSYTCCFRLLKNVWIGDGYLKLVLLKMRNPFSYMNLNVVKSE